MVLINYPLEELYSYNYNSTKYKNKLETAITNGLWDYAAVLVWKNTILFIYEKLFQLKLFEKILPEDFNRQLNKENITVHTCFDFCCIPDDNIYTNLHKIWCNVESNYKQLFKGLLDDRNSLSHVNKYEEDFNEQLFKAYLEKSIKLIKYLQGLHNVQFASHIYHFFSTKNSIRYISEQDIDYLCSKDGFDNTKIFNYLLDYMNIVDYSDSMKLKIKKDVIKTFLESGSFADALSNGKRCNKLTNYFNTEDVREILKGIFERQGERNQIIASNGMEQVLIYFFDQTINIEGLEEDWKIFIDKAMEYDSDRYKPLKDEYLEICGETRDPSEFF